MKKTLFHAAVLLGVPATLLAGSYTQTYEAPLAVNATTLGDGSYIGATPAAVSASVQAFGGSQRLRLTQDGVGGTSALYRLPDLDPGSEVIGFNVQFDLALSGGGGTPADGFSLNFGALPLTDQFGPGEEGYSLPYGMVISFDTYINNPPETTRTLDVRVDGVTIATKDEAFFGNYNLAGVVKHITVNWDAGGLDMYYQDVTSGTIFTICENVAVPGLVGSPGDRFAFSARTGGATESVFLDNLAITTTPVTPVATPDAAFNELVVRNTSYEDEHCETPGYVELYNGTPAAINLSTYTLTDDAAVPGKWAFPAGTTLGAYQYLVVFLGNSTMPPLTPNTRLHTNFTLSSTGGYLGMFKSGVLVDSFAPYPAQGSGVGYGYIGDPRVLGYLETPTPASRNRGEQAAGLPVDEEVAWPRDGGLLTAPLTFTVPAPVLPGGVIRYTTDNSAPTLASTVYTPGAPVNVTANTTLRARIFAPGRLPGKVTSRTFFMLESSLTNYRGSGSPFTSNLPVVVIDSYGRNLDAENNTTPGARPMRPTYNVLIKPNPAAANRAVLSSTNDGTATGSGVPVEFQGRSQMRVRGESSAGMPQRQYGWETIDNEGNDKAVSMLGLASESDWVLYAPSTDKTLMRNFIAYNTMLDTRGQGSAMQTRFVEVFFNQNGNNTIGADDYRGVYVLMEKIKRDKNRVDIEELTKCDVTAPDISGGYIFKKDKVSIDPDFTTNGGQGLQIVEPEVAVGDAQWTWPRNYVNTFEAALNGASFGDPVTGYRAYIDEESFMDNEWWVEVYKQIDGMRLSTYFTKDRLGKIKSAPLWDYNLSGGNGDYLDGWKYEGWYFDLIAAGERQFYHRLHQDPGYMTRRWDRYWELRRGVFSTAALMGRIDTAIDQLNDGQPSVNIKNSLNWDITNYAAAGNTPQFWPNSVPSVEVPSARHHARWQRLGVYDWPNAPGRDQRDYFTSTTDAADFANFAANGYNVDAPPAMSETVHLKAYLKRRLDWIDNANRSGTTVLRPPVFSQYGGNVIAPYNLTMAPYTGTAPAGFSYASGDIYYTLDGSDPIGTSTPGTVQNLILDTSAISASVPTSAAADTDVNGKSWRDWDFTSTAYNATTNPSGWVSGINGVGYDDVTASGTNFLPHINIKWSTTANVVAGMPVMRASSNPPGNATCYIRLPFSLTAGELASVFKLRLYGKVDDGFVVYLNNVRIAEKAPPVTLAWNSATTTAVTDADAVLYKEFALLNNATAVAALRTGSNVLAVHALNAGVNSNDLLMRFKLDAEALPIAVPSANAIRYTGPVALTGPVTVRARQFDAFSSAWTPLTEGSFVVSTVPASSSNIVVSEIMYNTPDPTPAETAAWMAATSQTFAPPATAFEYIELMNISANTVDLGGLAFINGFTYLIPADADPNLRTLPPGGRILFVGDVAAFNIRYAPAPGVRIAGVMAGNLSNSGEKLTITVPDGPDADTLADEVKSFTYDDTAPWPEEADGAGYSLVLNNPLANPDHSKAINWRASNEINGTPGGDAGPAGPVSGAAATADTDGDGFADIVEYATGTVGTSSGGGSHHWPVTGMVSQIVAPATTPSDYLTFEYRRSRSADGFIMQPEASTTLGSWVPLDTLFTFTGQTSNEDGTVSLKWRSTAPASTLGSRIFFQVKVLENP